MTNRRTDSRIDQMDFPDTGCALHDSCLRCPRVRCIYDDQPARFTNARVETKTETRAAALEARREAARRLRAQGYTVYDIVAALNVSERTVQRAINGGGA